MAEEDELGLQAKPVKTVSFSIEIEPPETYVYSNVAGVTVTPWDVRINFADVNVRNDANALCKTVVGVVMPPEHAAGLALLLMDQLHLFEAQFGKIRHRAWRAIAENAIQKGSGEPPENEPQS